jgi:hypothetical protein
MRTSEGALVVVDELAADNEPLPSQEVRFHDRLNEAILARYRLLLARTSATPEEGSACTVTIHINLETGELQVVAIQGSASDRIKALVGAAVLGCSGKLSISVGFRKAKGKYYDTEITLHL